MPKSITYPFDEIIIVKPCSWVLNLSMKILLVHGWCNWRNNPWYIVRCGYIKYRNWKLNRAIQALFYDHLSETFVFQCKHTLKSFDNQSYGIFSSSAMIQILQIIFYIIPACTLCELFWLYDQYGSSSVSVCVREQ